MTGPRAETQGRRGQEQEGGRLSGFLGSAILLLPCVSAFLREIIIGWSGAWYAPYERSKSGSLGRVRTTHRIRLLLDSVLPWAYDLGRRAMHAGVRGLRFVELAGKELIR